MKFPKEIHFPEMVVFDILERIDLGAHGMHVDPVSGKIEYVRLSIDCDAPWDHVHPCPEIRCKFYQMIFNTFKFVPSMCMDCWKVVIRPRTIQELFALRDVMRKCPAAWHCKCGTELRNYTPGLYGGYYYCRGIEQGRSRYGQVRRLVSMHISPGVPVSLKRYCTEYELELGDTMDYVQPPEAKDIETILYSIFDESVWGPARSQEQPWYVKFHVYQGWLKWAWKHDRENAEKYNDENSFYSMPRTYESMSVDDIRENLKQKS